MVIMILSYCCNSSLARGVGRRRMRLSPFQCVQWKSTVSQPSWAALCLCQAATFYLASEKKSTTSWLQELLHKRSCVYNRCSLGVWSQRRLCLTAPSPHPLVTSLGLSHKHIDTQTTRSESLWLTLQSVVGMFGLTSDGCFSDSSQWSVWTSILFHFIFLIFNLSIYKLCLLSLALRPPCPP